MTYASVCHYFCKFSSFLQKKERRSALFSLGSRMLLVIRGSADAPQIRLERLLAVGIILLCEEVLLVGVHVHQVLFACLHGCCNCRKTGSCPELVGVRCSRARHFASQIDTIAFIARCCCHTVRAQQHLGARVLTALARF